MPCSVLNPFWLGKAVVSSPITSPVELIDASLPTWRPIESAPADPITSIMTDSQDGKPDLSDTAADAANEFLAHIYSFADGHVRRFGRNFYNSFASLNSRRWWRVIGVVVIYLALRPLIHKLFKWMYDRSQKNEKEKKEKEKAEFAGKAKVSANALRGGGSGGKVLGEVDSSGDEVEEDEEDVLPHASGVPEWSSMARKRQKKYLKSVKKQNGKRADDMTEEQMLELLDWSDDGK